MTISAKDKAPIYSEFGDDPDLGELVEMFVGEMEGRIAALRQAFEQADDETLGMLAHQLKGAAGSYGFDSLTAAAFALERTVREQRGQVETEEALGQLIDLCTRTRAGSSK